MKRIFNSKMKIKVTAGFLGLISIVLVGSVLANVFATASDYFYDSANVSLNGTDDGTAYMYLRTIGGGTFYTMQGDFSISETNDENGYMALETLMTAGSNGSTSVVNFDADGFRRMLHTDSNYDGNEINANNPIMIAIYSVDKDTPAGDYTVSLSNVRVVGGTSGFDGEPLPNMVGTIHVTRNDTPPSKLPQTIILKDSEGHDISGTTINKNYGDASFEVTVEHTVGDGAVSFHPDDDEHGDHVARTEGNNVVIDNVGTVDICAWAEETEEYAAAQVCITVNVSKRPLDIIGATIANKSFDGTTDATVTDVSFEDVDLPDTEYTATATFDDINAGENKTVHVTVNLTESAANHYTLNASNYDTTKTVTPYQLAVSGVNLVGSGTYSYSPAGVEPEVMVTAPGVYGGTYTLVDGQDYEVTYSDNTSVGLGHVSVAGKGNFTTGGSPIVLDFTIEARGINSSYLVAPNTIVEGRILSPSDISINIDGIDLTRCETDGAPNCDYVLSITGNTGFVGDTVNVMAEGRNNYTGVAGKDISIVAKLEQTVSFSGVSGDITKTYGDGAFTYTATSNGDGAVSYTSSNSSVARVDLNSGSVTIVGAGEANIIATAAETDTYAEGTTSYHLVVNKKTITVSSVTVSNKTYDGTTDATVTSAALSDDDLLVGDGFSIDEAHFMSANAGSYNDVYVRVKLDSDAYDYYQFAGGSMTAETTGSAAIVAFTLGADNAAATLNSTSYAYNGDAKEPTANVTADLDGNGSKEANLIVGTDYEINYDNNTDAGTATATITGKGNYTGSLAALEFTITPATVTDVVVTVSAQTYTGSALTPEITVTGTVNGASATFTTNDYAVAAHEDFVNAGDHTVTINAKEGSNYNIPSTSATFTINKADSSESTAETPTNLAAENGKTLADLGELPEGFAWVDPTTPITAGMNSYPATYTKNGDALNYTTVDVSIPVLGFTEEYEVIKIEGQNYIIGVNDSATFEINADYSLFETGGKVYVDNTLVDPSNYESWSNSTVIKFKKAYMDSLALGNHSLAVVFNNGGVARTTFNVSEPAPAPGTADTGVFTSVAGGAVATGFTVIVAGTLIGTAYVAKKRKA